MSSFLLVLKRSVCLPRQLELDYVHKAACRIEIVNKLDEIGSRYHGCAEVLLFSALFFTSLDICGSIESSSMRCRA